MHTNLFWGKHQSGCAHQTGLGPEDCARVQGEDRAEPLAGGRIVADRGDGRVSILMHAEEDIGARSEWAGRQGL